MNDWKAVLGWGDVEIEELRVSGFSHIREGLFDKAIMFFEALVILEPYSVYDLQTLGGLYLETNENLKAIQTLNKALLLEPNHQLTQLNKTKALISLKRLEEGLAMANMLLNSEDFKVASEAEALILGHVKKKKKKPVLAHV